MTSLRESATGSDAARRRTCCSSVQQPRRHAARAHRRSRRRRRDRPPSGSTTRTPRRGADAPRLQARISGDDSRADGSDDATVGAQLVAVARRDACRQPRRVRRSCSCRSARSPTSPPPSAQVRNAFLGRRRHRARASRSSLGLALSTHAARAGSAACAPPRCASPPRARTRPTPRDHGRDEVGDLARALARDAGGAAPPGGGAARVRRDRLARAAHAADARCRARSSCSRRTSRDGPPRPRATPSSRSPARSGQLRRLGRARRRAARPQPPRRRRRRCARSRSSSASSAARSPPSSSCGPRERDVRARGRAAAGPVLGAAATPARSRASCASCSTTRCATRRPASPSASAPRYHGEQRDASRSPTAARACRADERERIFERFHRGARRRARAASASAWRSAASSPSAWAARSSCSRPRPSRARGSPRAADRAARGLGTRGDRAIAAARASLAPGRRARGRRYAEAEPVAAAAAARAAAPTCAARRSARRARRGRRS